MRYIHIGAWLILITAFHINGRCCNMSSPLIRVNMNWLCLLVHFVTNSPSSHRHQCQSVYPDFILFIYVKVTADTTISIWPGTWPHCTSHTMHALASVSFFSQLIHIYVIHIYHMTMSPISPHCSRTYQRFRFWFCKNNVSHWGIQLGTYVAYAGRSQNFSFYQRTMLCVLLGLLSWESVACEARQQPIMLF